MLPLEEPIVANDQGKMAARLLIGQLQQVAILGEQAAQDNKLNGFEVFMLTTGASALGTTILQVIKSDKAVQTEFFQAMRTFQLSWTDDTGS